MIDWTDRHLPLFSRANEPACTSLYRDDYHGAILRNLEKLLGFSDQEHPVALQLGGSEPNDLAQSAKIGEDWGYDEINLNCGCPERTRTKGSFGLA